MNKIFVEQKDINQGKVIITGENYKHIANVLRMKINDEILISDGQCNDYCCIIERISKQDLQLSVINKLNSDNELPIKVSIFQGLPKKDKMEYIIQKSVELGAFEIIPVAMKRSIVKIEKDNNNKIERWNKISLSAAAQAKRGIVPEIKEALNFSEALKYALTLDEIIVLSEIETDKKHTTEYINTLNSKNIGVFIGPEGGFDKQEFDALKEAGAISITLGKRILRTETASLAILAVLGFLKEE